jgi:hypothetical protein
MCDLIEEECEGAEADLEAACERSLAHGALLATRYLLAEMTFRMDAAETEAKLKVGEKAIGYETRPLASVSAVGPFSFKSFAETERNGTRRDDARGEEENQAPSTDDP